MIPGRQTDLPVETLIHDLEKILSASPSAVLQAPPGAGKTTCVPLALLNATWLKGRRILLLAPRRLAARAAAERMARLLGETVGQTVGYRVRMESRVSEATRIEAVTEGVLTRMLQNDPSLAGVGLVIFDEFHERNLDADLGLALCSDMQGVLNEDLRLLVMSATLETAPVADLLDHAPVLTCTGKTFPVETRYVGLHSPSLSLDGVTEAVCNAVRREQGSILVFLPGAGEIRRVQERLARTQLGPEWTIAPLFGHLSRKEQDMAIAPPPTGQKKIVLATSIAGTSLTIEGIQVVVDSGLQRVPRFDVRSGLTRLVTIPVSRASADQRRGRAGRTGPGTCYRLWSEGVHSTLVLRHRPEILEADLAGMVLEMALWGVDDPNRLKWLDPPPEDAFKTARNLLQSLGAIHENGAITDHGKVMLHFPVHPRLAHMIAAASREGQEGPACDLAALITERDVVHYEAGRADADIQIRFDLLQSARRHTLPPATGAKINHSALSRVVRAADYLRRAVAGAVQKSRASFRFSDAPIRSPEGPALGRLLAWAYPDRVAQDRETKRGHFLLVNGRGAYLNPETSLGSNHYLVAFDLDGHPREARIFRAADYDRETLLNQFGDRTQWKETIEWDPERKAVAARRELTFGALVLAQQPLVDPDDQKILDTLLKGIEQEGAACLPWTKELRRWQGRVGFLRRLFGDAGPWPDVSDEGLESQPFQWLAPALSGITL